MADRSERLSFVEKAGYSLGDAAANFVFMTMIVFQMKFYTDTMGLAAGVAGMVLLVGRLWDAFFDPMMGIVADRTNTRWGKFRPWILWTALPWSVIMVLAYSVPHWKYTGLVVYACVTNTILMTLYSANNTPYSALTGVMTGDIRERNVLSAYRFVAAMIAQLIVGSFTLPLVEKFGGGDSAKGWQMTIGLWAILCFFLFLVTFATVRERIQPDPKQKGSIKGDFSGLAKNLPWIAMFVLTLAHFIYVGMRGSAVTYFFDNYLDRQSLADFLKVWGLGQVEQGATGGVGHNLLNYLNLIVKADGSNAYEVGYSLLNTVTKLVTLVGVLCSTWLVMRFGKKAVAITGFGVSGIFMASYFFLPRNAIWGAYLLEWSHALTYSPTIPLLWAMFADVADYAEWKTGRRTTGLIYATIMFGLKTGLSLGGFLLGQVLGVFGYQAPVGGVSAPQTDQALLGIRLCTSLVPTVLFIVCIVCLIVYPITKKQNIQIQDELAERRKSFAGKA
jgi:glycoside/pentoside/hexuronide:cation symporter, GPH family